MDWEILPIDETGRTRSSLKKDPFNSGAPELDEYLKMYAFANHKNGVARVFVAFAKEHSGVIAGYYTSSMSVISTQAIPDELRGSFPKETPAMLIGRLAVDESMKGRGLGKKLLKHAFECAIDISKKTGVYAVHVKARDEQAKEYYSDKCGFIQLLDDPFSLFLPMQTIKAAYEQKQGQQS